MRREKQVKKHGYAYKKMFLSFVVIIVLISSLNSIITYVFGKFYSRQVEMNSQSMLQQIGIQMTQRIFEPANTLYLNLITNQVQFSELNSFLKNVGQSKSFDPISYYHIYCSLKASISSTPEKYVEVSVFGKNDNMVISSSSGVNWLSKEWSHTVKYDWADWITYQGNTTFWEYTPKQYLEDGKTLAQDAAFVLYGTYPFNVPGRSCSGAVKIEVDLQAISSLLKEYSTPQTSYYFIDRQGQSIASVGEAVDFTDLFSATFDQVGTEECVANYNVNGTKAVVVSRPYENDYILVSITSLSAFYEHTNRVNKIINLVELSILLFGFLLARFFSNRLYRPLLQLIEPAEKRYGNAAPKLEEQDEYNYINGLMENLSLRASSLESVLEQSFPLICDGFFQALLYGPALDENEIQEKLRFLHLSFPKKLFCVVKLFIPQKFFGNLKLEQKELLLYGLLNRYDEYKSGGVRLFGTKSGGRSLTLIVNLTQEAMENQEYWIYELSEICNKTCQFRPQLCIGPCVSLLSKLRKASQQTDALEPYLYYFPDRVYITADSIPALSMNGEQTLSQRFLKDFINHLRLYDEESAKSDISRLIAECKTGRYAARYCSQQLFSAVSALVRSAQSINLTDESSITAIYTEFLDCYDIDHFHEWFSSVIHCYFKLQEQNATGHYSAILQNITDYIRQHLLEPISLESLADLFQLSPNYLSRLFKEVIGINYTDYVNNARLEIAAELLSSTAKNIDVIAEKAGFNSAAYFIKKFKYKYGVTPKKYRIDAMTQKNNETEKGFV